MLYEMRVYDVMPGRIGYLHDRFSEYAVGLFKEHGIGLFGVWTAEIGTSNQLTFILTYDSMADRETRMNTFLKAQVGMVRPHQDKDPLVAQTHNTFMVPTPYFPTPKIKSNVDELRIYDAVPGKMQNLHDRSPTTP